MCGLVARLICDEDGRLIRRHVDHIQKNHTDFSLVFFYRDSTDDFMIDFRDYNEALPLDNNGTGTTDRSPYPRRNRRPPDRFAPLLS